MEKTIAIVPAAGSGRRMGAAQAKQFMELAGVPILARTLLRLNSISDIHEIIAVVPAGEEEATWEACIRPHGLDKVSAVIAGGRERQDSVAAGVDAALAKGAAWLLIHDGVRPLAGAELFSATLAAAKNTGAAVCALKVNDTVKRDDGQGLVAATLEREGLWLVQTPQVFTAELLARALGRAKKEGFVATDEAGLVERAGGRVALVPGEASNIKITRREDLALAEKLCGEASGLLVGQGFDVHRLVPDRPLILGGVRIPFELGLAGHSDADVLVHALMDAVLAAAGLGDIGRHFPDSDPAFAGADSMNLLARVLKLVGERGLKCAQATLTLAAQRPKIAPHVEKMRGNLATALGLDPARVNIAATTTEGLGFTGRGEGMAAMAMVSLRKSI